MGVLLKRYLFPRFLVVIVGWIPSSFGYLWWQIGWVGLPEKANEEERATNLVSQTNPEKWTLHATRSATRFATCVSTQNPTEASRILFSYIRMLKRNKYLENMEVSLLRFLTMPCMSCVDHFPSCHTIIAGSPPPTSRWSPTFKNTNMKPSKPCHISTTITIAMSIIAERQPFSDSHFRQHRMIPRGKLRSKQLGDQKVDALAHNRESRGKQSMWEKTNSSVQNETNFTVDWVRTLGHD